MRDESEKEVIHRLEAFSDIVIGFGLAQLGLSLTIPAHIVDLFERTHGLSTIGTFALTFLLVCSLWWLHHRLFRHLFVPTRWMIGANFAGLGGVLFFAYAMQVILHVGFRDRYAFPLYMGSYAYILLIFSIIAWNGLYLRGAQLPHEVHGKQVDFAVRLTLFAMMAAAMALVTWLAGASDSMLEFAMFVFVLLVAVYRMFRERIRAAIRRPLNS